MEENNENDKVDINDNKDHCYDTQALIITDFKIKYGTKSTRATTIEHFKKKDIGGHGFVVVYYLLYHEGINVEILYILARF